MTEWISIEHAVQNNLKDVSVKIPKHEFVVVTGLSGSGKSSLVFDTLAAASRRQLNDTFATFVQQYLPKYDRPDVQKIENLPVAIVVDQKKLSSNARSTVGTYTDIYTYLRLLFSRVGEPFVGYSNTFSFNNPEGKCPECDGLGTVTEIDVHKLIDFDKSLNEDAIDFPTFKHGWRWKRYAYSGLFDLDKPIKDYDEHELYLLLYQPQTKLENPPKEWPKTALYEGVVPRMERSVLHKDEGKRHQKDVDRFVTVKTCPVCHGTRVSERVLSCKINGKNIGDVVEMPVDTIIDDFLAEINDPVADEMKHQIQERVQALVDLGLGYLTLSRETGTLSGGEAQRVKISKYMNSELTDMMYILDEPSAGLHPKDVTRFKAALLKLRDKGNTVIVVEHNPIIIESADYIIEIGPGSGANGGELIFDGPYDEFKNADTLTSNLLRQKYPLNTDPKQPTEWIPIEHVQQNNVHDLSLEVPMGVMTVVCGVAGSGKSSLSQAIYQQLQARDMDVISIGQKTVGVNLRSTPLTYLNIFEKIRKLFADATGLSASEFSYNGDGACPACNGKGVIKTEMAFMDDVTMPCDVCHGTRYKPEMADYKYHGKSIVDVLAMTIDEGTEFFAGEKFDGDLQSLVDVGLGYLHLNQSLSTLSGGELQRLKLARYLSQDPAIYILDEPTDGLHLADISHIINLFKQMVADGSTLFIMDHHTDVMKAADWLIEMGPEGGINGGQLMFAGTPQAMVDSDDQITRPFFICCVKRR
ncbi:excinuclease ABC A subunit [Weissella uvarum]|uniref:ATP-binding cassette domain-containing protein n=1 Tax=Weissella uvarum TaxID=1479233 RepID=UPI0019610F4C|nr:excinuclease ABC subunit UvrA [Weissella uvarum]MBM7617014.1 excinuclease ABC A subunit [Weissella uvarum]MCM0595312.1 excinuclease ABC subunit UvrA [Weissella uvarum]